MPRTALPRIYFIDRQIASLSYPNTRLLAETYETSEATISRDIDFMRTMLNAPIAFDHAHNGYYYEDKTFRLSAGYATAEEMLVLGMVKNLLSLYHDTPIYETMRQLLDIIGAPIAAAKEDSTRPGWYEDRIVVPPIASAPVSPETWAVIVKGLRDNRLITFDYTGSWDNEPRSRRARPWQLLFDTGVWYLYAWDEDRADIRMFSLSRMRNAALTETAFTLPADYDYRIQADGSYFGVFHGKEKKHFRVVFFDEAFSWAKERKWAADQTIEETTYSVTVDFTSTQYEKVLEWVLSRGSNARPLEPPELVTDWKDTINEMQKRSREE
ncbi:putative HTH-type transcriptional regulator YobV [Spirochaetia bacterium]|nr:putative HTH-type transcriptional regulator YobV [Spirochaetia bacterium]